MLSDNSTTFQGASNEHARVFESWRNAANSETLRQQTTKWKFIPPSAPHMGGLHEAAVKSAKHHLKRVIGAQQLPYEELATLLAQVEGCLNSRPIQALSEDANDCLALTPGNFLIGEPIIAPITKDYRRVPTNRLKQFQLMAKMAQEFWERWSKEYVTTLMQRNKWHQSQRNMEKGDIVLIVTETLPPTQWPLGRIVGTIPGDDGHVRVADILSNGTIYRRPIVKLCLLPIEAESSP